MGIKLILLLYFRGFSWRSFSRVVFSWGPAFMTRTGSIRHLYLSTGEADWPHILWSRVKDENGVFLFKIIEDLKIVKQGMNSSMVVQEAALSGSTSLWWPLWGDFTSAQEVTSFIPELFSPQLDLVQRRREGTILY